MQNVVLDAGDAVKACRMIEVPRDRHHAVRTQQGRPLAAARQRANAVAIARLRRRTQRYVSTDDH